MSTDIKTRIDALRPPPPPTSGNAAAASATPSPDDPRRLVTMLVDLSAELWVTAKSLEKSVSETKTMMARIPQDLPQICRQAAREEFHPMQQHLVEQRNEIAVLRGHVSVGAASIRDCVFTLRGLCFILVGVGLGLLVAFIRNT